VWVTLLEKNKKICSARHSKHTGPRNVNIVVCILEVDKAISGGITAEK